MTKNRRNYYRILHVQPDAPAEILRSSYRTLMQRLKMHPDLGGDHWNASLINEAFQVLSDPECRAQYDEERNLINRETRDVGAEKFGGEAGGPCADSPEEAAAQETAAEYSSAVEPDLAKSAESAAPSNWPESVCLFCLHPTQPARHLEPEATCPNCDSPLYHADQVSYEDSDQRKVARIDRNLPVRVFETWPQANGLIAMTQDLSPNGVRLATFQRISDEQRVKIVSDVFDAVAWVTNTHAVQIDDCPGWSIGIVFETLIFHRSKGSFISLSA